MSGFRLRPSLALTIAAVVMLQAPAFVPSPPAALPYSIHSGGALPADPMTKPVPVRPDSVTQGRTPALSSGPKAMATPNGSGWVNLSGNLSSPPDVAYASAAYDAADGYVIRFGGRNPDLGNGLVQNNYTWSYSAGSWTNLSAPVAPCPRDSAAMAYDAKDGYVLLFSGNGIASGIIGCPAAGLGNDTWKFVGGTWTQLHPAGAPSPRYGGSMTYDAKDGYIVLWGGNSTGNGTPYNDTWTFAAGVWSQLSPRAAPSFRLYSSSAYFSAGREVVLFGGFTLYEYPQGYRNETWAYSGGTWTNVSPPLAPPLSDRSALADDPGIGALVMFVGLATDSIGRSRITNETWLYNGTSWRNVTTSHSPPPRVGATLTYDPADGYLLLSGGEHSGWLNDTWAFVSQAPLLTVRLSLSPPVTDVGGIVGLQATAAGPGAPFHFGYSGLPAECTSLDRPTLNCTPVIAGSYSISVTVRNATGSLATGSTSLTVNARPQIRLFQATPNPTTVGNMTVLAVALVNGTPPYGPYAYDGLPPGCASSDSAVLPCTPTAAGLFLVHLRVSDRSGFSSAGSLALRVTLAPPPPSIPTLTHFEALPNSIVVGNLSVITTSVSGGVPPLQYAYTGLPPGCGNLNNRASIARPRRPAIFPWRWWSPTRTDRSLRGAPRCMSAVPYRCSSYDSISFRPRSLSEPPPSWRPSSSAVSLRSSTAIRVYPPTAERPRRRASLARPS
jgi:Kelch motif